MRLPAGALLGQGLGLLPVQTTSWMLESSAGWAPFCSRMEDATPPAASGGRTLHRSRKPTFRRSVPPRVASLMTTAPPPRTFLRQRPRHSGHHQCHRRKRRRTGMHLPRSPPYRSPSPCRRPRRDAGAL